MYGLAITAVVLLSLMLLSLIGGGAGASSKA